MCRESIEERILHLHEVKKNVLANIWAEGGEDAITAPGGSGAFRQMVEDLLTSRKEGTGEITGLVDTEAQPQGVQAAVSPAPATGREGDGRTQREHQPSREASASLVDRSVVAAAVAAVAPALPPDHRRSLATVFRALAEALEA